MANKGTQEGNVSVCLLACTLAGKFTHAAASTLLHDIRTYFFRLPM